MTEIKLMRNDGNAANGPMVVHVADREKSMLMRQDPSRVAIDKEANDSHSPGVALSWSIAFSSRLIAFRPDIA
jgi:hypothetical protein